MTQPRNTTQQKTQSRAFTLVELMVALTGGIFFTIFVFMMSKDAARFFQGQARSSETTLATITGFERLRNDIARAGFMSSPNLRKDVNRCPRPAPGSPSVPSLYSEFSGLSEMGLAHIFSDQTKKDYSGNVMLTAPTSNSSIVLNPDQLILWGNYTTAEQFPARTISGTTITLETGSTALYREGIDATSTSAAVDKPILERIFRAGSILRIVDETGREQYSVIASIDNTNGLPVITLATNPALVTKASDPRCGLRAHAAGTSVNPVDIIRYRLADLSSSTNYPDFAALFFGSAGDSDSTRLELVRERLRAKPSSHTIDTDDILSTELVAEYAVDLKFGLTVQSDIANGILTYYGEDDSNLSKYAGLTTDNSTSLGPHLIRGIHARLAIRNRDPDRSAPALGAAALATATPEDLIRVQVGTNEYARMRSLRSHIITRNSRNETW